MQGQKSMPLASWPEQDRAAWLKCCSSKPFIDSGRIACLRESSKRLVMRAYGEWLRWLSGHALLDDRPPGDRITPERICDFVESQLERGLALSTICRGLQALITAAEGMCPNINLKEIRKIGARVHRRAKHQHKPKGFIVHAARMYAFGIDLIREAYSSTGPEAIDRFVDGLIVAMMTACPLRIADFSAIHLSKEIARVDNRWRVTMTASKTSKADLRTLPKELTSFIDVYVEEVRPRLIRKRKKQSGTDRFFIGTSGLPLNSQVMRRRIEAVTAAAFGEPVLPHSFRKLAVTTLILEAPEHAPSASALLRHTDGRVTEEHYFIRQQLLALERYHDSLRRRS